jgi:proline racemase
VIDEEAREVVGPTSTGTTTITSIDVHAEGEAGRILLGAHLLVRGATWPERMRWCEMQLDWLRRLLLREPRGHPSMCAVLVLPPLDPAADVGIIVLEQGGFRPMSGATLICAVTALLETGSLPATEPETVVRVDTAVGAVEATARVEGGRVRWVRVRNVPSFALALDRKIVVPEYGAIAADIAFGGQFYVMARAADMGVALGPEHAPAITRAGTALLAAAREQVPVAHPEQPDLTEIGLSMLHGPADSPGVSGRNSVILPSGRITLDDPASWRGTLDRSPGGTGTSARMAALHARGELGLRVPFVHEGVLGTTFRGMLLERTTVGGHNAVIPSIQGRAWITGHVQHVLQPDDPFPTGLTVGDIWSPVPD